MSKIYIDENSNCESVVTILKEMVSNSSEVNYYNAYCLENGYGCPKDKQLIKKYYAEANVSRFKEDFSRKKRFGLF